MKRSDQYGAYTANEVLRDIDERLDRLERAVLLLTDAPGSPHASAQAARDALLED